MQDLNRREVLLALSAFAAFTAFASAQANAQGGPAIGSDGKLSKSVVFNFDELKAVTNPGGSVGRQVMSGTLPTGEFIEVHETMLPAGKMPHPPHKHRHSEMLLIREGKLEFLNDGVPQLVGPGGVVFTASNIMHGLKNVGDTPANYFVVAVGVQEKE